MHTLLFGFPTKGASTSTWYFLKGHPQIQSTDKKFMSNQSGDYFWPSHDINSEDTNIDTTMFLKKDVNEYYKLWNLNDNYRHICIDGTDNILDKHYFNFVKIKLTEFKRICGIYTILNPFISFPHRYICFNLIYPEYSDHFSTSFINRYQKFTEQYIISNKHKIIKELIEYYPSTSIHTQLIKLYKVLHDDNVMVYFFDEIKEKQKEIFDNLNIDNNIVLNTLPHRNNSYKQLNSIFKYIDHFKLFKLFEDLVRDSQIFEMIYNDCLLIKKDFGIDIIQKFNIG